jgi:hypothetical protein
MLRMIEAVVCVDVYLPKRSAALCDNQGCMNRANDWYSSSLSYPIVPRKHEKNPIAPKTWQTVRVEYQSLAIPTPCSTLPKFHLLSRHVVLRRGATRRRRVFGLS